MKDILPNLFSRSAEMNMNVAWHARMVDLRHSRSMFQVVYTIYVIINGIPLRIIWNMTLYVTIRWFRQLLAHVLAHMHFKYFTTCRINLYQTSMLVFNMEHSVGWCHSNACLETLHLYELEWGHKPQGLTYILDDFQVGVLRRYFFLVSQKKGNGLISVYFNR